MIIEKRIRLKNSIYLLGVEVKYKKNGTLSKKDNTYFDIGDFSLLIDFIENNYQNNCIYDEKVFYMDNIIYLYDRFPFISYIKDVTYDQSDNQIFQIGYIEKEEIDGYIKENNIKIGKFDGKKSICPLLYK